MKKLITIFLSSIVCISLMGQKVPMVVIGDVYVGNYAKEGKMRSVGAVHLKANAPTIGKYARVANYGEIKFDSVYFYSNKDADGLLMNQNSTTSDKVGVRKNFYANNNWHQMSFPFDVDMNNGIINPLTGVKMVRGVDFEVQFYDSWRRALGGYGSSEENWTVIPTSTSLMKKGVAYRVAVDFTRLDPANGMTKGNCDLDFVSASSTDITSLFAKTTKGVDLTFATHSGTFTTTNSEGWNAIGGLNSTLSRINSTSASRFVEYNRTIYYRNDAATDYIEFYPNAAAGDIGTLRPYGVIFVKTDAAMSTGGFLNFQPTPRVTGEYGGFTYFYNGITLDKTSYYFLRSSEAVSNDLITLMLTEGKNSSNTTPAYFKINDKFSKFFKSSEDDIMFSTKWSKNDRPERPKIWSIVKEEGKNDNYEVFVNSIPSGEHEIPMGFFVPTEGEYIFSLKDFIASEDIKNVILFDKKANIKTDLLLNDYRFNESYLNDPNNERFTLFINRTITSINPVNELDIYAFAANNVLTVKNLLRGDQIRIYDITGRIVASGIASTDMFSVGLNQKGVYIVNVSGSKTFSVFNK